jgi:dephospho-CoA kinase
MKTFRQYIQEEREILTLLEKQIIIGKGKKYGQIVFMAGGAGSGKGFAVNNFIEGNKFKVRDVDQWKKAFLILTQTKKKFKEIRGLDLHKPKDAFKLHKFIQKKGIKEKTLNLLLSNARQGILPNLLFDITLKDKGSITEILPSLVAAGYDTKNINIVWVLTDYSVAIKQNRNPERGRVVPEDIMLQTHEGAATTMFNFIKRGTPRGVNGGVYIVLGGKKNTVFYTDKDGKPIKTGKNKDTMVVKNFSYITMKEPGRAMTTNKDLQNKAFDWIMANAPRTLTNKNIFGSGQETS